MHTLKTTIAMLGLAGASMLSSCVNTGDNEDVVQDAIPVLLPLQNVVSSDRFIKQTDSYEVVLYHVHTMADSSEYVVEKTYNFHDNLLSISAGKFAKGASGIELEQIDEMTFDQMIEEDLEQGDMDAAFDVYRDNAGPSPK